jgi:hypothetical protein
MILNLHCDHSTHLVSNEFHGLEELSRTERCAVRLHELCCRSCRQFRAQVGFIKQAAESFTDRELTELDQMPTELRERIRAHIQRKTS